VGERTIAGSTGRSIGQWSHQNDSESSSSKSVLFLDQEDDGS
jgi:hypothetical protein